MDWARSETKGGPAGSDQYELGGNDGRPGGELRAGSGGGPVPVYSLVYWGRSPGPWDIIPVLVATRVRLATVAARSS